jgi:hypothetical protein
MYKEVSMKKYLVFLLCISLMFSLVLPAGAASSLSAKQLLVKKLNSNEPFIDNSNFLTASGSMEMELTTLEGVLTATAEQLKSLPGSKLKASYSLDAPEKKIGAEYTIEYDNDKYTGEFYLDNDKMIVSTGIVSLLEKLAPGSLPDEEYPEYIYFTFPEMEAMWNNMNETKGQSAPPELKDLFAFLLEAVPDKYLTFSLAEQKVIFEIDDSGLYDIIYACYEKVQKEPERFAEICVAIMTFYNPAQDPDEVKKEIMDGIAKAMNEEIPDSPEELAKKIDSPVALTKLRCEFPVLPGRENKITLVIDAREDAELDGQISLNIAFSGDKDSAKGDYQLDFSLKGNGDAPEVHGNMNAKFEQTTKTAESTGNFAVTAKQGGITMLDLALGLLSSDKADRNATVNVPALTPENSMNMDEMKNDNMKPDKVTLEKAGNSNIKVFIDGNQVNFEVEPYINNNRTMVPLKDLATELGCEVQWEQPGKITLQQQDSIIIMNINQLQYSVNETIKEMESAPELKGQRTFVPLRFVAEALDCQVSYDINTNSIYIITK